MKVHCSRLLVLGAALIAVLGLPFSASAAGTYYVSLGDSLAAGFQPDGTSGFGYADQLSQALPPKYQSPQLQKFGCFGETTVTMTTGGVCFTYAPYKSQLDAALAFLNTNKGFVTLITIDIGANDVNDCSIARPLDMRCITDATTAIETNLPSILKRLSTAAPGVPIIGMNYYDPYLAYWLLGGGWHAYAADSKQAFDKFNDTLERIYKTAGWPVANVEGAFSTFDFATKVVKGPGMIPLNVARICEWTWACSSNYPGDIHVTTSGYTVIRDAFLTALP